MRLFGEVYNVKLLSRKGEVVQVRGLEDKRRLEQIDRMMWVSQIGADGLHKRIREGKADPISDEERAIVQRIRERHIQKHGKPPGDPIDTLLKENGIGLPFSQRLLSFLPEGRR